jgi:hypothetical protein
MHRRARRVGEFVHNSLEHRTEQFRELDGCTDNPSTYLVERFFFVHFVLLGDLGVLGGE